MKKVIALILFVSCIFSLIPLSVLATEENAPFDVSAKSAVLMEAETGRVLYAKNPDEALPPASVTKIMTLLLVMEAIDSGALALTDTVSVSEYAASMGGSQVFLEPFEEMSVDDMLKSVVVSSANDAAVALAEKVGGSEEAFVKRMNERAAELGMTAANFENVTGLDDDTVNHVISAMDIAIASRELITKHPLILQYSSIWMDTIRNGAFGLSNTNRLIRFYSGATGLKTGSTSKAGFCISATACREGMHLIAVIMGSETRDIRNASATQLLDWGFANYTVFTNEGGDGENIRVTGGIESEVKTQIPPFSLLLEKGKEKLVETAYEYSDKVPAPVSKGDKLGEVVYTVNGEEIGRQDITASADVDKISFDGIFYRVVQKFFLF